MKEFIITRNEAGQRADKLLVKEEYHAERKKDTGKRAAIRRRCAPAVSGRRNDTKISGGGECRESTGTQSIAPNAAESAKAEAGYHL